MAAGRQKPGPTDMRLLLADAETSKFMTTNVCRLQVLSQIHRPLPPVLSYTCQSLTCGFTLHALKFGA